MIVTDTMARQKLKGLILAMLLGTSLERGTVAKWVREDRGRS